MKKISRIIKKKIWRQMVAKQIKKGNYDNPQFTNIKFAIISFFLVSPFGLTVFERCFVKYFTITI